MKIKTLQYTNLLNVILFAVACAMGVASSLNAQQETPAQQPRTESEAESTSIETFHQLKRQALTLSEEIVKKINSSGISSATLADQEKLQILLSQILQTTTDSQMQPLQAEQNPSGQNSSKTFNGEQKIRSTQKGSQSGIAPVGPTQSGTSFEALKLRTKLADAVWGHLPPQERDDLIRTYSDAYLPAYENQVRNYFEQLAKLRRRTFPKETESSGKQ